MRLRGHEREWGKLDKLLRSQPLLAVRDGAPVDVIGRDLHRDASLKMPLVRVRDGQPARQIVAAAAEASDARSIEGDLHPCRTGSLPSMFSIDLRRWETYLRRADHPG